MHHNITTFEHIGSVKNAEGVLRIDIKTRQCVIAKGDVQRLIEKWPVSIYDIAEVISTCGQPEAIGQAWISRSGKAVLFRINGFSYVSPLSQVRGILSGDKKYAHLAMMVEQPEPGCPAVVAAPGGVTGVPA
ncbi:MAG TPA: hypothetical protein PLK36_06480 [Methanoregulaceae archaeon]|nr:hypothetical protein [Methanoregulaceae archaeon]HQN89706.1 hypothetical protein [Methanoregulaceae archaeon]